MKMNEKLQNWELSFNKSIERTKLSYPTIKNMLEENGFSKKKLVDLVKIDKDFAEQLKILSENSISAFELLSIIIGDSQFLENYENIHFHDFDIKSFDNKYVFDQIEENYEII